MIRSYQWHGPFVLADSQLCEGMVVLGTGTNRLLQRGSRRERLCIGEMANRRAKTPGTTEYAAR